MEYYFTQAKAAGTEEEKENAASTIEQPIPEDPEAEAAAEKAEADAQVRVHDLALSSLLITASRRILIESCPNSGFRQLSFVCLDRHTL